MLAGNILAVSRADVRKTALLFRVWDFLFHAILYAGLVLIVMGLMRGVVPRAFSRKRSEAPAETAGAIAATARID